MAASAQGLIGGHPTAGTSSSSPRPGSPGDDESGSDDDPVARDNALLSSDPMGDLGNGLNGQ